MSGSSRLVHRAVKSQFSISIFEAAVLARVANHHACSKTAIKHLSPRDFVACFPLLERHPRRFESSGSRGFGFWKRKMGKRKEILPVCCAWKKGEKSP